MESDRLNTSVYHRGEIEVQQLAGASNAAEQNASSVRNEIPKAAADFLHRQTMIIAGSTGADGDLWASMLTGPAGFISVSDPQNIIINPMETNDVIFDNLNRNPDIGLLAIELVKRRRMRMNGQAAIDKVGGIHVRMEQVYGNCPKYIQAREQPAIDDGIAQVIRHDSLNDAHKQWITQADTFFIATSGIEGKTDASHRGGAPGFIRIKGNELWIPDYFGNSMFNTLGNIHVNPRTGLLFVDFETGNMLQITGLARIEWDPSLFGGFPGAERLVVFEPAKLIETVSASAKKWKYINSSPFNPK
ncbi:pyridoxamine 5'-phosphate oxidase family protein [Paenibacillus alkalitolerans]|uniref:pyridoxamine 5'-phosphate oxidase family protein n=1 Tax=Paenibacillus alkalitolerans TaxID=2799335 RepID=UPI0018F3BA85|nr:pyridoxamine 5'-phosphate oxidase family protein [Paenibacillus alkalitolerans]